MTLLSFADMLWTAAALALAPVVPSAPPSDEVAITWTSVEGCPDRDAVESELSMFLAERHIVGDAEAVGSIALDEDGYILRLDVQVADGREQRTLHAADCAVLTRAGALVIAVTVDALATASMLERIRADGADAEQTPSFVSVPDLEPTAAEDERQTELGLEAPPASRPVLADRTHATPRRPTRWPLALSVAAHGGLGLGLVPGPGGGVEGELGFRFGPLIVQAAGYHWFARTTELEPDAGVRVAVSGGRLRGGYAWSIGRVDIPFTLGVDVAAMHGAGTGARVDAVSVRDLWVALAAGPGVEVWLSRRFALTARIDASIAMARPAMFLRVGGSPAEAYRMPDAGFRLMLGGRVRFWETSPRLGGAR